MTNIKAIENQAKFWKAFAYLAVKGQVNEQAWGAAAIQYALVAPQDEEVEKIISEAKAVMAKQAA